MLKGFVSGEEKDIVRIPMKGKNLFDGEISAQDVGMTGSRYGFTISGAGTYTVSIEGSVETGDFCYLRIFSDGTYSDAEYLTIGTQRNKITKTILESETIIVFNASGSQTLNQSKAKFERWKVMVSEGDERIPYEPYGYQEGWEVRDNQDRLIWGREDELQTATGTLPFKGYALPVKVKSLLGNAVQNGTPSPQNIVVPEMCGVRTGNLLSEKYESRSINGSGAFIINDDYDLWLGEVVAGQTYTISNLDYVFGFFTSKPAINAGITYNNSRGYVSSSAETVTVPEGCTWIAVRVLHGADNAMLNSGSTALPYEPHGWKVPFENHGENLWSEDYTGINGSLKYVPVFVGDGTFTMSTDTPNYSGNAPLFLLSGNVSSGASTPINGVYNGVSRTVNSSNGYVTIAFRRQSELVDPTTHKTMLTPGSTPKPYSPYLNATIPVYLGEVPTVRRVRKLVLDGTENWKIWAMPSSSKTERFYVNVSNVGYIRGICSHFPFAEDSSDIPHFRYGGTKFDELLFWIDKQDASTVADFKAYLASEYQAGHPVTVWYVLANERTGIVNEPLCKISTYADELTTIQVHGLSAPLYGIGDYKDTLNLSTGVVTRKIKKLVLTGQENIEIKSGNAKWYIPIADMKTPANLSAIEWCCSHYQAVANDASWVLYDYMISWSSGDTGSSIGLRIRDIDFLTGKTVADFKAFLAAQYQAGTPVTVWYVLDTPETETVTVPTGMTGEIEGYLTQVSTPTPTNRSVPKWNGVEETGGTYAVTVYTPPEIPTTTGQNTLTVDSNLAPSKLEVSIHAKKIHYGFKIDKSNDNSESAVIYTHDAVTMTPAYMDFTNDRFDYGSWENAFFVRDCYPVALNLDGTIAYRLDPDDYTKKTDGTASDIFYELLATEPSDWSTQWKQYYTKSGDEYVLNSQDSAPTFATDTYYKLTYNSSFTGNFMMAFPKVWFYRHEDSQYNYVEISNHRLSDDWKCYAHINTSGQEVDFIYLPLFKGVIKDSKLRSIPGRIPQGGTTATTEVNAAAALGSRWQIWDHSSVELINDLLTLMSKSIDSQGRFGKGRESGYNSSDTVTYGKLQTGTLIKGGKFHGFSSSYKEVKVFGIEGFWANRWDRLQGMLLVNNVWKIKMTPPYNFTGTDFVTLSNAEVPTGNGYLSKVQTSEYGSIPASVTNGSSTKYFKDYFYKTATDTRVAFRGGSRNSGASCGFRYVDVSYAASHSNWAFGASPVYK